MFSARRSSSTGPKTHAGSPDADDVTFLRVVDADAYADWESVYRDNVGRIYRLMYARVGNRPDAEDLTSEVFKATLGPLRLASSKGEVRSYLLITAATVLASYWRHKLGLAVTSIDPQSDVSYLTEQPGPEQPSDAPERAAKILDALPERYRRILELRFLETCSIKEAASAMNVTVSNAKVLQHRALQMATKVTLELGQ
jgi:RNA polymerase sigma-70 factor (ECF subfamily)